MYSPRVTSRPQKCLGRPIDLPDINWNASSSSDSGFYSDEDDTPTPAELKHLTAGLNLSPSATTARPLPTPQFQTRMAALAGPGEETPPVDHGQLFYNGHRRAREFSKRLTFALALEPQDRNGMVKGPIPTQPFRAPPRMPAELNRAYVEGRIEYGADWYAQNMCRAQTGAGEGPGGGEVQMTDAPASEYGSMESLVYNNNWDAKIQQPLNPLHGGYGPLFDGVDRSKRLPKPTPRNPKNMLRDTSRIFRRPSQLFHKTAGKFGFDFGTACSSTSTVHSRGAESSLPTASEAAGPFQSATDTATNVDPFFATLFTDPPCGHRTPEPERYHEPHRSSKRRKRSSPEVPPVLLARQQQQQPTFNTFCIPLSIAASKIPQTNIVPVGLPPLPPHEDWGWNTAFSGNTIGLADTLLTWHTTLRTIYAETDRPELLKVHPMFPYPPCEPSHVSLLSASFWDAGAVPTEGRNKHNVNTLGDREVWRIGPGDVDVLSWDVVDTFSETNKFTTEWEDKSKVPGVQFPVPRLKRLFGNRKGEYAKAMKDRAMTGEGRWCFFVVRGRKATSFSSMGGMMQGGGAMHVDNDDYALSAGLQDGFGRRVDMGMGMQEEEGTPAPYVVIAFPSEAISRSTECLHILPPDASLSGSPGISSARSSPMGFGFGQSGNPQSPIMQKQIRLSSTPAQHPAIRRVAGQTLSRTQTRSASSPLSQLTSLFSSSSKTDVQHSNGSQNQHIGINFDTQYRPAASPGLSHLYPPGLSHSLPGTTPYSIASGFSTHSTPSLPSYPVAPRPGSFTSYTHSHPTNANTNPSTSSTTFNFPIPPSFTQSRDINAPPALNFTVTPAAPNPSFLITPPSSANQAPAAHGTSSHFSPGIRTAASSGQLHSAHQVLASRPPPLTVRRTILYFEKAGFVPLIEGYGTDVNAWRPWLEAVGQGRGKVVVFSGVEGEGVRY